MGKVTEVLVTLASRCDFCLKGSSARFSENKLIVGLNSNCCDAALKRTLLKNNIKMNTSRCQKFISDSF